ncbi:MAG: ABC transporter substrate-binding protein [Actinomycetota bacterium]|nr:ABC transporter substrate-binding protein [Actinomycetota bacterium]
MTARRGLRTAAAASLLAALVAGCSGGGGRPVDVGGGAASSGGAQGGGSQGGGTLTAALSGEPDQLDPHKTSAYQSFQVLENVYDTLVQPGAAPSLTMEPALAERWQTSPDGRTWTFTLRQGVRFHNGNPFAADDVVYSYRRIIDEKLSNAYRFAAVKSVTAKDPQTVVLTLTRPAPNLLEQIGGFKGMAILDKETGSSTDLRRAANGTGPFKLANYRAGNAIELVRNDTYWGGRTKLDGVTFRFVKDPTVALTDLQSGQVQWTDNLPPQQVASLQSGGGLTLGRTPSTDYWYFAANQRRKPFDDVRVRQALAFAIDREAVVQAATFGAATVNQTAIPRGDEYFVDHAPYRRDVARARELLAQAGRPDLRLQLMVTDEYPQTVQAAQVMVSQFKEAGITAEIRSLDFASWLDNQTKGDFDVLALGWLGNLDPDDFYYAQHHSKGTFNAQKYANPEVDRLLDAGRSELDPARRKGLYDQAVRRIVDDASYVYLYNPEVVQGWKGLQGYVPRPDRAVRFKDVSRTA